MMIIFANDTFFQGFKGVTCNANKTLFCSLLHNTICKCIYKNVDRADERETESKYTLRTENIYSIKWFY